MVASWQPLNVLLSRVPADIITTVANFKVPLTSTKVNVKVIQYIFVFRRN